MIREGKPSLKDRAEGYEMDCGYEGEEPTVRGFIWSLIREEIAIFICSKIGHKGEEESDPESGSTSFHCNRCGWGFHGYMTG